jgi:prevent-host-death family protein
MIIFIDHDGHILGQSGGNMQWKIAEAKRHFSELVRAASDEPQLILNRDRVVAAVIDPSVLKEFEAWRSAKQRPTLGDVFAELRAICIEENYTLKTGGRMDRPNAFVEMLDELPD